MFDSFYYNPFNTFAREHMIQGKCEVSIYFASNDLRTILYASSFKPVYVLAMETGNLYMHLQEITSEGNICAAVMTRVWRHLNVVIEENIETNYQAFLLNSASHLNGIVETWKMSLVLSGFALWVTSRTKNLNQNNRHIC